MTELRGSFRVDIELSGIWALSLLTADWTDEDRQALLDGDAEAKASLIDEAVRASLVEPHQLDVVRTDLRIHEVAA